jgi:hypothetical protein
LAVFFGEPDADGDASVEADVEVFFAVEVFAAVFFVEVAWVVAPVVPAAVVVSSFFAQEVTNAAIANAVIKDKTDVFIGLVKLNENRECRSAGGRASTKIACLSAIFVWRSAVRRSTQPEATV